MNGECKAAAWQLVPTPSGSRLNNVWGIAVNDVWVVGDRGTILHWNGSVFEELVPPDMQLALSPLLDVWGAATDDVWIAASPGASTDAYRGSHIIHWDGAHWDGFVPRPPPAPTGATMTALWGSGASDVWAVGGAFSEGTILHYDGTTAWTAITATTLPINNGITIEYGFSDLWGSAANDVWAVGQAGIWHDDGTAWTKYDPQPSTEIFRSVSGSSTTDVWLAAESAETPMRTIYHFDGTTWMPVAYPLDGYVSAVWSAGPNDVWAVGTGPVGGIFHYDGARWTVPPSAETATNLTAVWGHSPSDIWALGHEGTVWHYTVVP